MCDTSDTASAKVLILIVLIGVGTDFYNLTPSDTGKS